MRIWRLLALGVITVALAPTWFRTIPAKPDYRPILVAEPITAVPVRRGEMVVEGAWVLDSTNDHFGSYSGLGDLGNGTLLAISDRGRLLRFAKPGTRSRVPEFRRIGGDKFDRKTKVDAEALTIDREAGMLWIAYEGTNSIDRRNLGLGSPSQVAPVELARFGSNSGPEAMTRLPDGRFVVLAEGPRETLGTINTGVVFDRDPVDGGKGLRFALSLPQDFRPVDMATLPDGRVLVLLRKLVWGLPPSFATKLMVADPTGLKEDFKWSGRVIATLSDSALSENYEGLAIEPRSDGELVLWLISDDNNARLQSTKLLKLRWDPSPAGSS